MELAFQSHTLDRSTGASLVKGSCRDGVYHLPPSATGGPFTAAFGLRTSHFSWHARLGHPSVDTSRFTISHFNLPTLDKSQVLGDMVVFLVV